MPAYLVKYLTLLAPYLLVGCLVLSGFAYVVHLRHVVSQAALTNAALLQTNQANEAAIAAYQAQSVKWNAALDTLGAQTLSRNNATEDVYQHIDAQPASADALIAPVLAQALRDIAKLQAPSQ